jgi:hypothetical protein
MGSEEGTSEGQARALEIDVGECRMEGRKEGRQGNWALIFGTFDQAFNARRGERGKERGQRANKGGRWKGYHCFEDHQGNQYKERGRVKSV